MLSPDRTYRLWRQAGLQVPRRRPRRRVATGRPRPLPPTARNHVWAYDFVFDTCANRQTLKCLTIVDEWTRECLAIDVAGGIRRHPSEGAVGRLDQRDASRRVVNAHLRQGPGDDHTRSVDTEMHLLPASPPPSSMFRRGPFTLAHDREARAVDHEMQAGTCGGATKREVEMLATPGERGVIGRGQLETQHPEDRRQEAFSLPQGQVDDEPERQRGFDGEIGRLQLPATVADAHGLPSGDRVRGQPHGDIASLDQRSVVCRPIPALRRFEYTHQRFLE